MRRTSQKLLALGTAAALGLAACGSDETSPAVSGVAAPVESSTTSAGAPADAAGEQAAPVGETGEADPGTTDDPASSLRSSLASLLQEHVYLAGIALDATIAAGDPDDAVAAAATASLDESSVALGDVIAMVSSPENGDEFLELWRDHIGFFADYALGRADEDRAAVSEALDDLEAYQETASELLDSITDGELLADEVFGSLEMHVTGMTAAIDAMVDGDTEAFSLLRDAADHMDTVASDLAAGIAEAAELPGNTSGEPAETRASLTSALQAHGYLAGMALQQLVEAGGAAEDPAVQAAVTVLDDNSVTIANTVGGVAGNDERQEFLGLWRDHVDLFVAYAVGVTTGEQAAAAQASSGLATYQQEAAAFLERVTGGALPADAVAADLGTHVTTVTAAIDAFAAGDPGPFTQLRAAAQHLSTTAATLAAALVEVGEAEAAARPDTDTAAGT